MFFSSHLLSSILWVRWQYFSVYSRFFSLKSTLSEQFLKLFTCSFFHLKGCLFTSLVLSLVTWSTSVGSGLCDFMLYILHYSLGYSSCLTWLGLSPNPASFAHSIVSILPPSSTLLQVSLSNEHELMLVPVILFLLSLYKWVRVCRISVCRFWHGLAML